MFVKTYDCNATIPPNKTIDNYPNLTPVTCSFCDQQCEKPNITSTIEFFDGFNGSAVLIVYIVIIAVSIIFELFRVFYLKRGVNEKYAKISQKDPYEFEAFMASAGAKINTTTGANTTYENSTAMYDTGRYQQAADDRNFGK